MFKFHKNNPQSKRENTLKDKRFLSKNETKKSKEFIDFIEPQILHPNKNEFSNFFKKVYVVESLKIFSIICGAVLNFFAIAWLITPTKTYGGGMLGAALIIYYLIDHTGGTVSPAFYQLFFIQLALNVPLIIFGFIKLGWKFTSLTLIYFGTQIILGLSLDGSSVIVNVVHQLFKHPNDIPKSWVMMSCLIGGVIYGSGCVLVYNGAGSTGGTDFISVYLTKTKNQTIGIVNFALNLLIAFIGTMALKHKFSALVDVGFFGSIMFFGVYSFIIDYFLPKQRVVSMHIISKNEYLIARAFKQANMQRGYTKIPARGGYGNDENTIFFVILSLHEYRILVNIIKKYDPDAFVVTNYVWKVKGNFVKKTWS
ncbi:YitT family protein [Mycoplasma sp. SG1]|uniref:YitT family protein n=1 Tax=Mycoplasma sp. SG1 TaxID=2810348 RepID=UPI0020247429|nr:YitT family protein [Mycoplasma sp. SG1]URM53242.1 YitT family protein [Mycoplasma sp. SG1]